MIMNWELIEHDSNIHSVELEYPKEESWALFVSDIHWDNPKCKRELFKRHLDMAVEKGAPVFIIGDFFCAMQGKYDRRSSKGDLRPEHTNGDYFDALVNTAADWLEPYKDYIALIGYGNHETSIRDRHETDLIDRLTAELRNRGGITRAGGYGGWLNFQFTRHKTCRAVIQTYYHHGFGGGGPVTQGYIDFNRYLMQARADIYVAGHVHYRQTATHCISIRNRNNKVKQQQVDWVRCGTYKDEYGTGDSGYHIEKGRGPRPLGGYWCRFYFNASQKEKNTPGRQFIATEGL